MYMQRLCPHRFQAVKLLAVESIDLVLHLVQLRVQLRNAVGVRRGGQAAEHVAAVSDGFCHGVVAKHLRRRGGRGRRGDRGRERGRQDAGREAGREGRRDGGWLGEEGGRESDREIERDRERDRQRESESESMSERVSE
jgi:hypothetical protein